MENCGEQALPEKAGPGWAPTEEEASNPDPGIPGLWSQQPFWGVSSEEREDVEEVKRKQGGDSNWNQSLGKKEPHKGRGGGGEGSLVGEVFPTT